MLELDGSDAGGQFVRTALTLSVLENEPIRVENVRGDRSTPGLRHQHLAVLETMAAICDADVAGAELGAETIAFDPELEETADATGWNGRDRGTLPGGEYAVDIGTAGSATLLFDAVLPLATVLEDSLSVTVTGGTDVPFAPPLDYSRRVKRPLLERFGLAASYDCERRGFVPEGGGRVRLDLVPSTLEPIDLPERGAIAGVRLYSTESASLADRDVAHRQAEGALERLALEERGVDLLERRERTAESPSPGSAIVIRVDHASGLAGFTALGERGTPAERVGEEAADGVSRFLEADDPAPVDRQLADQLLVFLALAGGRLRIPAVTDHVAASRDLLETFGATLSIDGPEDGPATVVAESTIDD